jgi:hypothetical protein
MNKLLFFIRPYHPQVYVAALAMAVIGMPLSKVLISISMFVLLGNWLLEGGLKEKLNLFFKNRIAVVLTSLYVLHLIGLFWTSDFAYALKDLKTKLPLLLLPLILSSTPVLSEKNFRIVLHVFLFALFCETMVGVYNLYGFSGKIITNMREMTSHVSHIRFSLMLCLGIFSIVYLFIKWKDEYSQRQKIMMGSLAMWFMFFLFVLQSANGLIIFFVATLFSVFYGIIKTKNKALKISFFSVIIFSIAGAGIWLGSIVKNFYHVNEVNIAALDSLTALGNPYKHDMKDTRIENGNRLGLYISWEEMGEAWNKRSELKFNEKDKNGSLVCFTLERFLTSKGYRKDAGGVAQLTEKEIAAIQSGVANFRYLDKLSFSDRVYEILWEFEDYRTKGNPSGHSVMQRFEYWKAAINIIKENKYFGVGTGDLVTAYNEQYDKMNSPLAQNFRKRAHNQYLTMAVAFGIFGLTWFLFSLFYPLAHHRFQPGYIYWVFLIIALLSFISEDTLESQAGLTFYAFFNSFFLFCNTVLKADEYS